MKTKIGAHIQSFHNYAVRDQLATARLAGYLALDVDNLLAVHAGAKDGPTYVFRPVQFEHVPDNWFENPDDAAMDWFYAALPEISRVPFAYIKGPFIMFADWAHIKEFAAFEIRRMALLKDRGLKTAFGGFSTGNPPLDGPDGEAFKRAFAPVFAQAHRYGKAWAVYDFQEYSPGWAAFWYGRNTNIADYTSFDPYPNLYTTGLLTFRYRAVHQEMVAKAGLDVDFVVSEALLDFIVNPEAQRDIIRLCGQIIGPWKTADPAKNIERAQDLEEFHMRQIRWYNEQAMKDPYLRCFMLFTHNKDDWHLHSLEGPMTDRILAYHASQPDTTPVPVPSPTPVPAPAPPPAPGPVHVGDTVRVNVPLLNVRPCPEISDACDPLTQVQFGDTIVVDDIAVDAEGRRWLGFHTYIAEQHVKSIR